MPGSETPPGDTGYENVAVCWSDDPSWTLQHWDALEPSELPSTHLVRVDELLVPAAARARPPAATWVKTGDGVDGIALYRRRGGAESNITASGGDETPPSGAAVMSEVTRRSQFAPNAVFCTQGMRAAATEKEKFGPFRVAPRYQGLGGAGPQPVAATHDRSRPTRDRIAALGDGRRVAVAVIDTGFGQGRYRSRQVEPFVTPRCLVSADTEDLPDFNLDGTLDAVAGHGTFVAGQIVEAEPQVRIQMIRAVDRQGAVSDLSLAKAIDALCELEGGAPDILNLALGGWTHYNAEPPAVAARLRALHRQGTAIVAAAGNLSSDRKFWPAAMEEVIGVGAVTRNAGKWVPTDYSNHGDWIKAAVEADTVVGPFYENFTSTDPARPDSPGISFDGFAEWEGTSFLAPQLAAAIARQMLRDERLSPRAAWERIAGGAGNTRPDRMANAVVLTREALSSVEGVR